MVQINANLAEVKEQILALERKQGNGKDETGSWDMVSDFARLEALRATAQQLREQNAPSSDRVAVALKQVSRVPVLEPEDARVIVESAK